MLKKLSLFTILLTLPLSAFADDATQTSEWVLNIRRIGVDWSKTTVKNADYYADSPIQALYAASQDYFKGVGDVVLEYRHDRVKWDNSIFTEYGRTKLAPYNRRPTVSENADKILFSSDYSYDLWDWQGFKFGPMARAQYETEYTPNNMAPRQKIARANAGFAVFDHPIVKDLHISGVYEYDFTYTDYVVNKTAAEFGWRIEYEIMKGVKASTNGYYREYLSFSQYMGTDLERDLLATARLDTNVWGSLTMGPYVQYRYARSREADVPASNLMLGISFNYITKFGLD